MSEENKALVCRNFEQVWNRQDLSVVDEIHDAHYVGHIASAHGEIQGPERFKQFVALQRFAFPDMEFVIEDQIAEGDKVATRWTVRGTHKREFMSFPASGRVLRISGVSIHRIGGGKIQESWDNWDALAMLHGIAEDGFEALSIQT